MAASLAKEDAALFLDTRTLECERVPLPECAELVVIDSGITHRHAGGEYKTRRAQCDEAARHLGVAALRDVASNDERIACLPEPLNRRVRHVVRNERVLKAGGPAARRRVPWVFDERVANPMRDDFEVSTTRSTASYGRASGDGVLGRG